MGGFGHPQHSWVCCGYPNIQEIHSLLSGVFFPQILLYIQTGDDPQEDLAKFGYGPDMKVIFFLKNAFIFWLTARTCCRNMAN